ncbi:lactosylceramide 4-alpha-galactosyltransferase isoform X1 [Neodiprion lecontei]|uniref:Lactosylceramide 4-alpha-galactosyltransferase isoform X1 n=2 Tax=Neodiprion lecontei TaxID=441921 RepID=A0A6J0B9Z1_NEOLC|nr:lactosylceramide 4-alpha-galactosyltransferase isoform X1 [Neodiprion lecontei]XP_046586336.1 lactosylceramide 4-alpha-galactosyltransferase isoform X1 [Neodiprion lecontei]XP_046586337.1 lactosylceramide 4-alpha-galactosyltransferase isoform X1 [Neodiprion lecontei]XP_046586339.1 lactosylceramide 4-alpha-galactosyltransferase isoform X1 [Neodiprion lecontei]XP_046586340.1 lactosylceramide 4-alpha-galactosyltransferase isoform X1 [Neodiprion lecontei]XP_046586341.1 lactosylceramide 4-alpha-
MKTEGKFLNKVLSIRFTKMRKRLVLGFASVVFLFILVISSDSDMIQRVTPFLGYAQERDVSCYEESSTIDSIEQFESEEGTISERRIFFHETSCFGEEGAILNARQACAVESAAMMNPKTTVYLLFVSPVKFSNASKEIVRQLTSYENVRIRHISMERYTKGTPIEEWYATDVLKTSRWPRSHMSDILRYLTLWKYGGIYLDLDVVVTSSLEHLTNFAGAEDWEDVAAGVLGFEKSSLGRRMADACLRDLKTNFRGDVWGNNGPGVITRILQKLCATKYARDMTTVRCHGFTVYPPSTFYPIHYKKWKRYFDETDRNSTFKMLEDSLVIHVWNKLSKDQKINVGSQAPYAVIAQKHCPKVYSHCGKVF